MSTQRLLPALAKRGLKASIRPGGILWLEPKANISDRVREVVRANKEAILAELEAACRDNSAGGSLHIPCDKCRLDVELIPHLDQSTERSKDPWYKLTCLCGNEGYILESDYLRWKRHGGKRHDGC